jgi:hypothetical protein
LRRDTRSGMADSVGSINDSAKDRNPKRFRHATVIVTGIP